MVRNKSISLLLFSFIHIARFLFLPFIFFKIDFVKKRCFDENWKKNNFRFKKSLLRRNKKNNDNKKQNKKKKYRTNKKKTFTALAHRIRKGDGFVIFQFSPTKERNKLANISLITHVLFCVCTSRLFILSCFTFIYIYKCINV